VHPSPAQVKFLAQQTHLSVYLSLDAVPHHRVLLYAVAPLLVPLALLPHLPKLLLFAFVKIRVLRGLLDHAMQLLFVHTLQAGLVDAQIVERLRLSGLDSP
jgi:hypothetical protein